MTTCTKCGAQAEGGSTCPRCGTLLPWDHSAKALAFASKIIAAACALFSAAAFALDYSRNGRFGWSLIALASAVLAWLLVGFPMLAFRKPALFLPVMGASALVYLLIIEKLSGGSWFLSLALPIALTAVVAAALPVFLSIKANRRGPNIGAFILFGGTIACLGIENVLSLHYRGSWSFTWSAIVAVAALSLAFLLLGIQSRLRPA
jgi:hypothetical protein